MHVIDTKKLPSPSPHSQSALAPLPAAGDISGMAPPAPAETAFEREVLPHLDAMYRVALRLTANAADAEDLVQDSVLRAFRAWGSFRQGTNARGWLLTILRNSFINDYRRRKRSPTLVDIDVAEPHALVHEGGGSDPEGEFFHQLVDDRIIAALDALPVEFREVVVLSDVEGLGYAQIAEMVGVPVGTVKSRLFRGRRQLQAVLRDYAVEAGIVRPGKAS
jgi:RNA polymerase sigma-70 factor (ECF subfamily)